MASCTSGWILRILNRPPTEPTLLLRLINLEETALEKKCTLVKSRTMCVPGLITTESKNLSNDSERSMFSTGLMTSISPWSSQVNQSKCPQRRQGASPAGSDSSLLTSEPHTC